MQDEGDLQDNAQVAPDGPFKVQIQFGIRSEPDKDGNYEIGYAKAVIQAGLLPTEGLISELAIAVLGQLKDGYRFMNRQEFSNLLAREATGCEQAQMPMGSLTFSLEVFS